MADLDPEICAQVYVDTEYRKKWDSYVLSKGMGGGGIIVGWLCGGGEEVLYVLGKEEGRQYRVLLIPL